VYAPRKHAATGAAVEGRDASADRIAHIHFLARDYIFQLPVAEWLAKVSILI
jgi:hypothetical protein